MNRFTKSVATIFGLSLLLPAAPTNAQIPGLSARFAHVFPDGTVDQESSRGITQDNVERVETVNDDGSTTILYCFIGLPRAHGGQVTINTAQGSTFSLTPFLNVTPADPEACSQTVVVMDLDDETVEASFYLLLY